MEIRIDRIGHERVWLKIAARTDSRTALPKAFALFGEDGRGKAPVRTARTGPDTFELRMNIADAGDGAMLKPGIYGIGAVYEEDGAVSCERVKLAAAIGAAPDGNTAAETAHIAAAAVQPAAQTALYETAFEYGRYKDEISVTVFAREDAGLFIRITDTKDSRALTPAQKKTAAKETVIRNWYRLSRLKHDASAQRKNVLFLTEQSDTLTENLTLLKAALERRNASGNTAFRIMTSARNAVTDVHLGIKSWLDTASKIAAADYIFMDDHAPLLDTVKLSGDTVVTQVWHGGLGFKATGYSRWGHKGGAAPFSCHRQYTWGICPSTALKPVYAEMWGLPECRVLPFGMPRLVNVPGREERIRRKEALLTRYPQLSGRKIILFAPTYRGSSQKNAYYPYEKLDFEALKAFCGNEYAVVFKMHPWIKDPVPAAGDSAAPVFADLSSENNMDLFSAADVLITDYSSVIYEFSLFEKPMIFYAFDLDEYERGRGFHLDYRSAAPGRVAETFGELMDALAALKNGNAEDEKAREYRRKAFDPEMGNSTEKIIDAVLFGKMPEEIIAEVRKNERLMSRIRSLRLPADRK